MATADRPDVVDPPVTARRRLPAVRPARAMIGTLGLKLLHLVPVLFLVSLATFLMLDLIPGDPAVAIAGPNADRAAIEQIRQDLGLDRPLPIRYLEWLGDTLTGDFGRSLVPPVQNIDDLIASRLPVTLQITLLAMAFSFALAIPAALIAAYRAGGWFDRISSASAFAAISIPSFLTALLLIFFAVFHPGVVRIAILSVGLVALGASAARTVVRWRAYPPGAARSRMGALSVVTMALAAAALAIVVLFFPDFPSQGFTRITSEEGVFASLRTSVLPALTIALGEAAVFMRVLRSDLVSTLQEDFILSARAKGMPTWRILVGDALRPSSFSLTTVAGVAFGRALGGAVIVETVFNLPGMGSLTVGAISSRDYPVVQACVLVLAVFYVVINAAVDVSYSVLDPRIRRGRR